MMLRTFVFSIKVPSLIQRLSSFFSETKHIGDHVVFNFTFPAAQNSVYFILLQITLLIILMVIQKGKFV